MAAYVDAYEHTVRAVAALAAGCTPEEWGRPTDCPGWSVADQVAHVRALEHQFAGDPAPPALDEYPAHVRNPAGEHMERGVVAYRSDDPAEAGAQLLKVLDRRLAALRSGPIDPDAETPNALGSPVPWARLLPVRVFDIWTHEQDIRLALGRPQDLTGPAAEVARESVLAVLPMVVAKLARTPAGSAVALDVRGEQGFAVTVRVGQDGRGSTEDGLAPDATTTLRTDFATMARLACGRVDPAAATVTVEGEQDLGRKVLAALAITP